MTEKDDMDVRMQRVAGPVIGYLRDIMEKRPTELGVETIAASAGMLIESFAIRNRDLREDRDRLQAVIDEFVEASTDDHEFAHLRYGRAHDALLAAARKGEAEHD